jgi:prenyltransferase beta subunit
MKNIKVEKEMENTETNKYSIDFSNKINCRALLSLISRLVLELRIITFTKYADNVENLENWIGKYKKNKVWVLDMVEKTSINERDVGLILSFVKDKNGVVLNLNRIKNIEVKEMTCLMVGVVYEFINKDVYYWSDLKTTDNNSLDVRLTNDLTSFFDNLATIGG